MTDSMLDRSPWRWVVWFAAALIVVILVVVARPRDDPTEVRVGDPRAQLESLGNLWLRTSATITYSTTDQAASQPASAHQCARQLVGGAIDRQAALRMCARSGVMTLALAPPDRWRMDIMSADGTYAIISTGGASYLCRADEEGRSSCVNRRSARADVVTPFGFILMSPTKILDKIGADTRSAVTQTPDRTIVGLRAECFSATGESGRESNHVGWCYSEEGILLYFSNGIDGADSQTLEATEAPTDVSDADFVPSSP